MCVSITKAVNDVGLCVKSSHGFAYHMLPYDLTNICTHTRALGLPDACVCVCVTPDLRVWSSQRLLIIRMWSFCIIKSLAHTEFRAICISDESVSFHQGDSGGQRSHTFTHAA